MVYVCFYVCCSDGGGLWEYVLCIGSVDDVVCLYKGCDGCCVFVCIVTRGTVGARVCEV